MSRGLYYQTSFSSHSLQIRMSQTQLQYVEYWSRESGDRLFEMTRTKEDQPSVLECKTLTTVNGVSVVQLGTGVNLAEDLVRQGHGVWKNVSSFETVSRTAEESSLMEAL